MTNDKNLERLQVGIAVATVSTVVALGTGGASLALEATAVEAGIIGGASGGMVSAYHSAAIEGRLPTGQEVAVDTTVGAVFGGGTAAIESKVIPAIVSRMTPKPGAHPSFKTAPPVVEPNATAADPPAAAVPATPPAPAPPPPPATPNASSAPVSQNKFTGTRGTWDELPAVRGQILEGSAPLPGTKINGNFSDFDRVVHGPGGVDAPALEVGQTKSIDTTLPGYTTKPRSIYTTLNKRIGEVAAIGEGTWNESGHKVVVGPQTRKVFDVILPPEALTAEQAAQLAQLTKDALGMGVVVRTHIMH